jgi:hypothetical protein
MLMVVAGERPAPPSDLCAVKIVPAIPVQPKVSANVSYSKPHEC